MSVCVCVYRKRENVPYKNIRIALIETHVVKRFKSLNQCDEEVFFMCFRLKSISQKIT